MPLTAPEWLTRRGGAVKLGTDQQTWFVVFDAKPHYSLQALPAGGKHEAVVMQTENGRRLEHKATYPSPEDALRGGIEALGKELGWA